MFTNEDVERVALDLYNAFNPQRPGPMPMDPSDPFSQFVPPAPEHIDDVYDGGRYRKLAKHVLSTYGKGV